MKHTVKFEKIVPEGKALGYLGGKVCFAIGPLPGETALVDVTKAKKKYSEAVLDEIVEASVHRKTALEGHFLSCSPWQGVDYEYQLELKQQMLAETFGRPELRLPVEDMVAAPEQKGYRNKLEFSLISDEARQMALAFHARRSPADLVAAPEGCILASDAMNRAALNLLGRVNKLGIGGAAETLTIRQSQSNGALLAVLILREVPKRKWDGLMTSELQGLVIARRVAQGRLDVMWQFGDPLLVDEVGGVELRYPYGSFFQTNVPMFEKALERIVAAVPPSGKVVDLYGGVGAIGLPVAKAGHDVTGVEIDTEAVEQANANARQAGLANYRAVDAPAERLDLAELEGAGCVIVDPPRAGLHRRVVETLLESAPKRIIYLSCNPVTQARDIMALGGFYRASGVTGFDFYPGTLHLESLVVLDRIEA